MYRTLQLCSNGGGFEALPDPARPLDLADVRSRLEAQGIPVVDARVMLIASMNPEVTLSRNGRILVKTRERSEAERVFERLQTLIDLAGPSAPRKRPSRPG